MRRLARTVGRVARRTVDGWRRHRVPRLGAALAFYTVLSLAPLVVVVVGVASLVFARQQIQTELVAQLGSLAGPSGAKLAQTLLDNAYHAYRPSSGVIASAVGLGALLFGASAVVAQLESALDTIWDATRDGGGIRRLLLHRALSFALVLGLGFLLLASLLFNAALAAFHHAVHQALGAPAGLLDAVNGAAGLALTALLIATMYRYLPDEPVRWRDAAYGAVLSALLFTAGKWLLGRYLGHSALASAYGAAGSLVIVLVWIYYSAQILFLGAEVARATAEEREAGRSRGPRRGRTTDHPDR